MRLAVSRPLAAGPGPPLSLFSLAPPFLTPVPRPFARSLSHPSPRGSHTQISRSMPWGKGSDAKHASSPKPSLAGQDGPTAIRCQTPTYLGLSSSSPFAWVVNLHTVHCIQATRFPRLAVTVAVG